MSAWESPCGPRRVVSAEQAMHRFFVPPSWVQTDRIALSGAVVHQIRDVLRLQPGDVIVALDDSGWEYSVRLESVSREQVSGRIEQKALSRSEPRTKITLYQSMLKGHRFEWALQKGTELGVVEFVPMVSDRCVISSLDVGQSKLGRWQRIIKEAAEQSRRARLPRLHAPMLFTQACERARCADLAVVPWEEENQRTLRSMLTASCGSQPVVRSQGQLVSAEGDPHTEQTAGPKPETARRPFSIHLFVGPEGGFTAREIDQSRRYGLTPVSLGPRILRAETAGLVAATMILYQLDDL
jgi:16S rRNA (uracil1498-N3)-methyltransferase